MPINSRNNLNISLSLFSPSKTGWPWSEQSKQLPKTMKNGKLWPKISIVTPSFNQVQFIEETIRSVILQNYPNLEYIIIDGGSTDGSVEIIKKYEKYLTYWVSEPDSGQSEAINKGWKIATGDIIAWLNSDDMYMPYALSTIASMYAANPDKIIFQGSCNNIDIEGNHLFTYPAQEMDS